ncbi:hypothetical protein L211DRAFT_138988 [Terfezia boudieri ATCC MYA-4762]|uniref:Uncharacterized protein n=1 Tax=Terfezia boudieri ATCC MYA-4762 TaxID=1051890 RepID=A0A3N4LTY4_9PEZI|nr:hypothetical protein L211DRAFT_138988 [Terfezia boudieri ATCC MYA-4762]
MHWQGAGPLCTLLFENGSALYAHVSVRLFNLQVCGWFQTLARLHDCSLVATWDIEILRPLGPI